MACIDELSEWGDMLGPSSAVGPKETTTTTTKNPDGTVSTTSTSTQNTYNYSFGPTYYNYSTTTKKTVTNADGSVSESEASDGGLSPGNEKPENEEPSYSFEDSEFPKVDPFYEQKYPDGLEGVWNDIKAKIDSSAFIQFLQGFIPNFSGSCPSFSLNLNIGPFDLGVQNLPSVCYALDFVKVILLFTAVMTFRALVFGG
ncbi:hypothetical protein BVH03_09410 [Pseudomonas sp. PA15(2017)]|nr:hypothetical protein BVH03_09410 [Pseudomonas sp. PA15(2017)]